MQRKLIAVAIAVLALGGCKSKEQKEQNLNNELQAVTAQYNKDCPKFDEKDSAGISSALGDKPTPQQSAAAVQRRQQIEENLNSPHCKELAAKRDDTMRKLLGLQSQ
jgi:outer membrane lipoprotein SlyB